MTALYINIVQEELTFNFFFECLHTVCNACREQDGTLLLLFIVVYEAFICLNTRETHSQVFGLALIKTKNVSLFQQ